MTWRVVSYYTKDSIYEQIIEKLIESAEVFDIPLTVYAYENRGSWFANCHYKSECVLQAMDEYPDDDIIFTDGDSHFRQYPALFDNYEYDLACLWLQWWDMYPQKYDVDAKLLSETVQPIMANGTIWIRNRIEVRYYIEKWNQMIKDNPDLYEQGAFQGVYQQAQADKIIKVAGSLPPEYCMVCLDGKPIDESVPYESVVIEHGRSTKELMDSVN
jgi:hypothetical protein